MLPFEDFHDVHKPQRFLRPPDLPSSNYPHLLSSSNSSRYRDISLGIPNFKRPGQNSL